MARKRGSFREFDPYVPVSERLGTGRSALAKLAKKRGRPVDAVVLSNKQIATSFWGKAWCQHIEAQGDFANRLPRGRTYVRNGSVLDLHISEGTIEAHVAGSSLYNVKITLTRLSAPRWKSIIAACAGRIGSLIALLQGELSAEVLAVLTDPKGGLFPAPRELTLGCSCPDGARMCKHVAATLYGVASRLDQKPELFFVLRQVDKAELLSGASTADVLSVAGAKAQGSTGARRIAPNAVASVFGIELDEAPLAKGEAAPTKSAATKVTTTKAPARGASAAKPQKKVASKEPARPKRSKVPTR